MQARKQQLKLDMEQQTGSKSGKEYITVAYCHSAYLTSMQSTSCEMPDWMNDKLESRLLGEISVTSDMQMIPCFMAESEEELKGLLMKVKEESEKSWLKTQHSENKDHGIWSHHFMATRWGDGGRVHYFGLQNHSRW